jgi:hypothetical protein
MKNRQRRVRAIELSLTPQQVVMVWLRDAVQAGTFEEGSRHSPPYRGVIANEVLSSVRNAMKGQPELQVERAVFQARREADLLHNLVVNVNLEVIESGRQRAREGAFLFGYLSAEIRGKATKDRVQTLRLSVLMFLESVIILDAAIAQVAAERLDGQPMLFHDCSVELEEQLQMVEDLSEHFNSLARAVDVAEINLEELRNSLQSETDRQISIWVRLAWTETLSLFGTEKEVRAAMEQSFLLFKSNRGEASDNVADA